ncbi:hypothetical protein BSKO_03664 [Bryopsis sp. KO-2023]|nr:hypothetical protein BSKO_03664 [Bryopsis sp. KO-2023]
MPRRSKFLDAGNFSGGESSDSDLEGFISDGSPDEGSPSRNRKLKKCQSEVDEGVPECDPILLDESDVERPGKRVLADSSSGSEGGPSPEKKRFRRIQEGCCNREGATPRMAQKSESDLEDDNVAGGGGSSRKTVVLESDEEGCCEGSDSKRTAGVGHGETSSKRFSLLDSDDEPDGKKSGDEDGGDGGGANRGVSEIMKRMMENRAKVLKDGGSSEGTPSTSKSESGGESESDGMDGFIVEGPAVVDGRAAAKDGEKGDDTDNEEDYQIDVRKLPDKAVMMIYLDFLMSMEFDPDFHEDFAKGKLNPSDCRLQAAKKIESTLCDLMDWAVESTWRNRPFLIHLKKQPYLDISRPEVVGRHCEACNRRSNPAEYAIRLHGQSYTPEWIIRHRPAEVGSKENENKDESQSETETEGDEEDDEYTVVVGRYCYVRLRLYHSMVHFRWKLVRYMKARVEKRMEDRGSTWEECVKALSNSDTLMTRLMSHYDALVKYAGAYVATSLPRKAALRGLESALCWMDNSLNPSFSLTTEEEKSADEGDKE